MAKKFRWDKWDYDCDGDAYIIAKSEVQEKDNVADYIIKQDCLDPECKTDMVIEEGWCTWQARSDWDGYYGPNVGYVVRKIKNHSAYVNGKPKRGWFPVWIIRCDEWY